jgi:hypothetical protein
MIKSLPQHNGRKVLVSRAINLPFDQVDEFDGSDAVVTDTNIKRQKKVR